MRNSLGNSKLPRRHHLKIVNRQRNGHAEVGKQLMYRRQQIVQARKRMFPHHKAIPIGSYVARARPTVFFHNLK